MDTLLLLKESQSPSCTLQKYLSTSSVILKYDIYQLSSFLRSCLSLSFCYPSCQLISLKKSLHLHPFVWRLKIRLILMLWSIFLSFVVQNNEKHQELYQKSFSTPVFFFLYSQMCGHCTSVHPKWTEFMKSYENSNSIIVAEMDCYIYGPICRENHSVSFYPTFAVLLNIIIWL